MNELTAEVEAGYVEVSVRARGNLGPIPEWIDVRKIAQAAVEEYNRQHRESRDIDPSEMQP